VGDSEPLRSLPELGDRIEDPAERVVEAARLGAVWTLGREARLRTILRMSLDPEASTQRPARRRAYIARLLESTRDDLSPDAYEWLVGGLTLLFGIDPIVSIRDNSDIDPERIPDVLAWAAHALVTAALKPRDSAGRPPANRTSASRRARG
jgi:hypothetical protein